MNEMSRTSPYPPLMNQPHPGLDYALPRPMERWEIKHLNTSIKGWLATAVPHLELATMALDELKLRQAELAAEMLFADKGLEPISWLGAARIQVLKRLTGSKAPAKKGRLTGHVYAILRDGYTAANASFGVYVGSTSRSVETRFLEHRTSSKAGRGLIAHGIEPLYSLFLPLGPIPAGKQQRMTWETMLHDCLARVVPKVTGDVAF